MHRPIRRVAPLFLQGHLPVQADMVVGDDDADESAELEHEVKQQVVREPVISMPVPASTLHQVESILEHRGGPRYEDIEYLVKWEGYGHEENSWEPPESFMSSGAKLLLRSYCRRRNLVTITDEQLYPNGDPLESVFQSWRDYGCNPVALQPQASCKQKFCLYIFSYRSTQGL